MGEELLLGLDCVRSLVPTPEGNLAEVDAGGGGWLSSDTVVSLIVEDDVLEIFELELAGLGHGSEMHDCGTVSIKYPDVSGLFNESNSASDRRRVSHTSDAVEILACVLLALYSEFIELTR